jgi:hypothetical protein
MKGVILMTFNDKELEMFQAVHSFLHLTDHNGPDYFDRSDKYIPGHRRGVYFWDSETTSFCLTTMTIENVKVLVVSRNYHEGKDDYEEEPKEYILGFIVLGVIGSSHGWNGFTYIADNLQRILKYEL